MADDFSPIYTGDTGAPFTPQFLHEDGSPVDLTGATISMKMVEERTAALITCSNTVPNNWNIDDAANGIAHRQWASADVATEGMWDLYITISINGLPMHADIKKLQIIPSP